jgi:16S rRNA (guanine527-N7)-methyltransferase
MERLKKGAQELFGLILSSRQMGQLEQYEQALLAWNEKFNLTAIRDSEGVRLKHFLDSLSCTLAWRGVAPTRLIDIGTGAGFPGLVLKILYPGMRLTLVDSVGKKVEFCRYVTEKLGLEQVDLVTGRAEELGQNPAYRERFDWAVARAVAGLPVLAEYLLPLVKVGGGMLAQKGESGPAEAQTAEKALRILGGHLRKLEKVTLPGVADERYLVIVDKKSATPSQYPRRVGIPAKKPLG